MAVRAIIKLFRAAPQISGSWARRAYQPKENPCQPVPKREALKEFATRIMIGSRRRGGPRRSQRGASGCVSRLLLKDLRPLFFSLQDQDGHERRQHGENEDHGERAGLGKVAVDKDPLGDFVADHLSGGSAHDVRNDIRAQRRDKNKKNRRKKPSAYPGKEDLIKRLEGPAPRSRAASRSWKSNLSDAA